MELDNLRLNSQKIIDSYIDQSDWRVKENSNVRFSFSGLLLHSAGTVMAHYALKNLYPASISKAHYEGLIHLHDLSNPIIGYCVGHSLRQVLSEGLKKMGHIESKPAKHLRSALNQLVNYLGVMQHEWAGAQAVSSLDTYLAPFIAQDNLSDEEVFQSIQEFIFHLNTTSRWGMQLNFTNITLDFQSPTDLKDEYTVIGGELQMDKYSDFTDEQERFNKQLLEVYYQGDKNGSVFTFPIPTINITKDFPWKSDITYDLFKLTAKYGIPYFQNFINSDLNPSEVRSMCVTGDSLVHVKKNNKKECIRIDTLIDEYNIFECEILTSQGYRKIKNKFKYDVDEIVRIETESGKTLSMSMDHPALIYKKKELVTILASDLRIGMNVSIKVNVKGENNPNYDNEWSSAQKEEMSNKKIQFYDDNPDKRLIGKKNGMFGKQHAKKTKESISNSLIGHDVNQNCRDKSSQRWTKDNPVFTQNYWDDKEGKQQISPLEDVIRDSLESIGIEYTWQKVLNGNNKTIISDFCVPSKNLIIEVESKSNDNYYNRKWSQFPQDRFDLITKELGYNLLIVNPEKNDEWFSYLNRQEKIVGIEYVNQNCSVYDIEIKQEKNKYQTHNFYVNDILTHNCCRLQLDLKELRNKTGGLFGFGESTGSIGVVTCNMNRIGYLAKDEDEYFELLDNAMELAKKSLEIKRDVIENSMNSGLLPATKYYLQHFNHHFSTIGLVGMNESLLNFMDKTIGDKEGIDFAVKVLTHMRKRLVEFQEETGNLYSLEATPAEGTSYRLAKLDKQLYPKTRFYNVEKDETATQYLTNSTQLPVDFTDDPFEALQLQEELQGLYNSGTVFHLFVGERTPALPEAVSSLIRKISVNYRIPCYSYTPTFSVCPSHGYLSGEVKVCPNCNAECEVYTRVVGYLRPISSFNKGKRQEYSERVTFKTT